MKVMKIMTSDLTTVERSTSLKEVAALLLARGISGVPVVEDGKVLGVVSETDIVAKEQGALPPERRFSRLVRRPTGSAKLDARTAGDAMTSPAVTIEPYRSVTEAATVMSRRGVNRLPVVREDGSLIGIVSRADLVRAFLRSDEEIEHEIRLEVLIRKLLLPPQAVAVSVTNGDVELRGDVETAEREKLITDAVAQVPGVVSVRSRLRTAEKDEPVISG